MSKIKNIEIHNKVVLVLNQLRPFLNDDGGDIEIVEITPDNDLCLRLLGSCKDCSISISTKVGIEKAIKQAVPEINKVDIIED